MNEPGIGVVIVTYNSADVVLDCIESLLSSGYPRLRIVICDNASQDGTQDLVRGWADGSVAHVPKATVPIDWREGEQERVPFRQYNLGDAPSEVTDCWPSVALIASGENRGFAGGVNLGLEFLKKIPDVGLFWILNPDCVVSTGAPRALVDVVTEDPEIGMVGSRVLFADQPEVIQADGGGQVHPLSGNARHTNALALHRGTLRPDPDGFDYIIGSNMIVTRAFLEAVGPMREDYFLFYEEVDWAARRGAFKLGYADGAAVYHFGGTATGSWIPERRPTPLVYYFLFRNRMRYVYRFNRPAVPFAYIATFLRVMGLFFVRRARAEALAGFKGLHGLAPPHSVKSQLDTSAHQLAFRTK